MEITAEGKLAGQLVMNVWHYYMEKEGGIEDGRAAALDVMNTIQIGGGWWDDYLACMCDQVTDVHLYAQWITPQRYAYITSPLLAATGVIGTDPLPPNDQASITLRSERAGRHSIGRKAIAGVPVASVTNGILQPAYIALLNALADKLDDVYVGDEGEDYTPVIFNRVTPELSEVIVEGFGQTTVRVERRRTVGVGA